VARLGLVLGALLAAGCVGGSAVPSGSKSALTECVQLDGQRIDSIRWSDDGFDLAVATTDVASDDGVIWMLDSTLTDQSIVARGPEVVSLAGVTNGSRGISWVEMQDGVAAIESREADGHLSRSSIGSAVFSLREAGGEFFGLDPDRTVGAIVLIDDKGNLRPAFPLQGEVESFDVSRDARRFVYQVRSDAADDGSFVLRTDNRASTIIPLGRLLINPTLGDDPMKVYYEDHDAMAVKWIDAGSGVVETVLAADASTIAVARNQLAYTFVDPAQSGRLCVTTFGDRSATRKDAVPPWGA